jgi:phosphoribosyl 1,2-cyclic phosphodiesterase
MSLFIASLNSGSNGNCYYVGNDREAILVDAGISCRETERRMSRLGLSMQMVKAIFVSHEHTDHISGIPVLAKKYRLPVYITDSTLYHGGLTLQKEQVFGFKAYEPVYIGNLAIQAFPKKHDAAEPHSFIVNGNNVNIGIFTDIGSPCENVLLHFQKCHAAFLEANYDEEMLEKGSYPRHLKNRIRGGHGHLSNKQALEVFTRHRSSFMSHLLLSHLSQDNNSPQLVQQLFNAHAGHTQIIVASRHEESAVYQVHSTNDTVPVPFPQKTEIKARVQPAYTQLRLW